MYTPKPFMMDDKKEQFDLIKMNSFAILFSQEENGPMATHLPFYLEERSGQADVLLGHFGKQNPHWQHLNNEEVLVVFNGPHAYISPTWYKDEKSVPTWNYTAVHVYGKVRLIEDKNELVDLLKKSIEFNEAQFDAPWQADFDEKFINGLMNGIVGIEIAIQKIEGKKKLNQNHSTQKQQKAIKGLRNSQQYDAGKIADLMEANIKEIEDRQKHLK
ncbi:FMN-binding negative transcriptional regulator [Cytobacillus purgationiresistens]|nr:FMN-binding negative transcriptional regulator [Cytobacillus purgationiresistens]